MLTIVNHGQTILQLGEWQTRIIVTFALMCALIGAWRIVVLMWDAGLLFVRWLRRPREICVAGHLFRNGVDTGEHDLCAGIGCTEPNESIGEYRVMSEIHAQPGGSLLRKSATWKPADDTDDMTVPQMVLHIYKNRKGHAVAPNGYTCPFISTEEYSRLADWIRLHPNSPGAVGNPSHNPTSAT